MERNLENIDYDAEFQAIMGASNMGHLEKEFQDYLDYMAEKKREATASFKEVLDKHTKSSKFAQGHKGLKDLQSEKVIVSLNVGKHYTDVDLDKYNLAGSHTVFYKCKFTNFNPTGGQISLFINCEFEGDVVLPDTETEMVVFDLLNSVVESKIDSGELEDFHEVLVEVQKFSQAMQGKRYTKSDISGVALMANFDVRER